MKKRIVLALGGNALGQGLSQQMSAVKTTARAIVDLVAEGHEVVITHGNGPQVGMIHQAFEAAAKQHHGQLLPISVCVALSQGYIGYDLQNALREELLNRGIVKPVTTLITQVLVDEHDPGFIEPSKPIGSFLNKTEAQTLLSQGIPVMEDSGRGWRRTVASPQPKDIIEKLSVKTLLDAGHIAITVGGGGIPVVQHGNQLKGVCAVIDKDWASAVLAEMIDADLLIILTAVEKIALNYNCPNQQWLDSITIDEAKRYISEQQFAKGSMLPKVEAAMHFAASGTGREALITLLEKAAEGIAGKTGTRLSHS